MAAFCAAHQPGGARGYDWLLPDPDHFISGHHAAIDYRDGGFFLRDTSTNGVYVNDLRAERVPPHV